MDSRQIEGGRKVCVSLIAHEALKQMFRLFSPIRYVDN